MTAPPDEMVPPVASRGAPLSDLLAEVDNDEVTALWSDLTILDVPLVVAPPSADPDPRKEFDRPPGWQHMTADDNAERLADYRPGHAVMAVTGGALVVVDVDPRHGGDVDAVRERLLGLGVRIFAEIETPGGGMHFYVAGHPDIDSHSGLPGWPGVDVQSYRRNAFLPGTFRPKYDGRGYRVRFNDLAALADGGDPDGADVLAGVLAVAVANRHTIGEPDVQVAPPWDGTPMPDRVRRYMDGAVKLSAERLSKVTSGGRNHALNGEVYALARFAAATGYPLEIITAAMVTACTTNGLVADDGLRSVHATIGSAIRAGRSRPRAVPEPKGLAATIAARSAQLRASGGTADESAEPVTDEVIVAAEEQFWSSRPELETIRRMAWARMVSPWSLLGCTLARLLTMVPPSVVLPPIVGSKASLNLFVGLVGPSGIGKDAANAVAAEMLTVRYPLAYQPDKGIYVTSPGSGEGVTHIFRRHEKGKPDGVEIRPAALMFAGEVDALVALGRRQGSTLLPILRAVWTGSALGHAYVDLTKAVTVPAHSYRLNLVVGIQPGRAAPLLDDADGGTPQRIVWMPAIDPHAPDPDHLPDEPPRLTLDANVWLGAGELSVPESIKREIRQARHRKVTGQADDAGDRFGGHLPLSRLKVAQGLAFLAGRAGMTEDDWSLAGDVIGVSEATRQSVQVELSTKATEAAQARGRLAAITQVATEESVTETAPQRVARRILRFLGRGPATRKAIRQHFNGTERPHVADALHLLVTTKVVRQDGSTFTLTDQPGEQQ